MYTVDDASTTEVDDGISVDLRDPDGWYAGFFIQLARDHNSRVFESMVRVYVHIADPTDSIPLRHDIDQYARDMASTIYLPGSGNSPTTNLSALVLFLTPLLYVGNQKPPFQ